MIQAQLFDINQKIMKKACIFIEISFIFYQNDLSLHHDQITIGYERLFN